ncbi:hypothetical protein F5Y14DRAFT_422103 [Nemania sp. NC0429]|nr:hypothetical protein F5Y14DRAFT_422103 [Nemania sp. NC0429]
MQFTVFVAALFASIVAASPLDLPVPPRRIPNGIHNSTSSAYPRPTGSPSNGCSTGLYSTPQCCATDALGVADLDGVVL